jgi:hypothetical protein
VMCSYARNPQNSIALRKQEKKKTCCGINLGNKANSLPAEMRMLVGT